MLLSEASGRPVVAVDGAHSVGSIAELVVDPHARRVVALLLHDKVNGGDTVLWSDVTAFGPDAVTIPSAALVAPTPASIEPLAGPRGRLVRKRLLTTSGDNLGTVDDAEFDPHTGALTALFAHGETIDGRRLLGCGAFAVVVSA
ncbi:PRC-barrel domain-containing protein [Dactylosporangium matsuzakiense]|uniref:PRC-barrel domain protein n=2 Tax=Dactylosporangium matsuzakiense TaxID=53360 RepID=A0A9W6KH02_9ACTN|nr:hypothetical protein [Dactylosporangium matsuzakiense]UWZ42246.1 hypothetical protein Dmats_32325 [Dactylosporangium matsuzakiense]GLK99899.1 hypothetical protein GCM10017581_016400 [Dactylosporangium matsuzakiense]